MLNAPGPPSVLRTGLIRGTLSKTATHHRERHAFVCHIRNTFHRLTEAGFTVSNLFIAQQRPTLPTQEMRKQKHDAGMEPNIVFSWNARGSNPDAFVVFMLVFMSCCFQRPRFPGRGPGNDNERIVYVNMTYTKKRMTAPKSSSSKSLLQLRALSALLPVRRISHAFRQRWNVRNLVADWLDNDELDIVRLAGHMIYSRVKRTNDNVGI